MKTAALAVVLSAFAVAAGVALVRFGPWGGGLPGSVHMWIALAIGAGGSTALWVGLMMLSFHSNRRGYDDAASYDD